MALVNTRNQPLNRGMICVRELSVASGVGALRETKRWQRDTLDQVREERRKSTRAASCRPLYQQPYNRIKKAPADLLCDTEIVHGRLAAMDHINCHGRAFLVDL